jgi:hypothetical protein
MEDVVGIRLHDRQKGYWGVITWGRIWDRIDDSKLCEAIKNHAPQIGLTACDEVELCESLAEIASAKYFYEAIIAFASRPIPFGEGYEAWREERKREISEGREIYSVGALTP